MVYIYILKLENNKYYIGKTDNPKIRLDNHFKKGGSSWTKKHTPTQIEAIFPECDVFDEDKYTIKYMEKFGIENVRGGSFCKISLANENKNLIQRMISSATDCCHFCDEKGHFSSYCKSKKGKNKYKKQNNHFLKLSKSYKVIDKLEDLSYNEYVNILKGWNDYENNSWVEEDNECREEEYNGRSEEDDDALMEMMDKLENKIKKSTKGECHRCGRNGHDKTRCYAKKHVEGHYIK